MMIIPAVAIAASLGLPSAAVSSLILTQDGRMDKFIAAPRITLPAELIPDHPLAAGQTNAGSATSVAKTAPAAMDAATLPVIKEKKLTLHVYSEQISDLVSQLQQQGLQVIINLSSFPTGGVLIDIDEKPESLVMATLGEAMGGAFLNRGGIWVWSKQASRTSVAGTPLGEEALPSDITLIPAEKAAEAFARDSFKFAAAAPASAYKKSVTVVVEADAGSRLAPRTPIQLSTAQKQTLKGRGFLRYDELSKYQKSLIPTLGPGQTLVLNDLKIKG
jgi:hypothetical protein